MVAPPHNGCAGIIWTPTSFVRFMFSSTHWSTRCHNKTYKDNRSEDVEYANPDPKIKTEAYG